MADYYLPGEGKIAAIKRVRSEAHQRGEGSMPLKAAKDLVDSWGPAPIAVQQGMYTWGAAPVQHPRVGQYQVTRSSNTNTLVNPSPGLTIPPLNNPFLPSRGLKQGDVQIGDRVAFEVDGIIIGGIVDNWASDGGVIGITYGTKPYSCGLPYVLLVEAHDGRDISQFAPLGMNNPVWTREEQLASQLRELNETHDAYVRAAIRRDEIAEARYAEVCAERDSLTAELKEALSERHW